MGIFSKEEALEIIDAGPNENYIAIELHYDSKLIVPFEHGAVIVKALQFAILQKGYTDKDKYIKPLGGECKIEIVAKEEVAEYKMRYLMGTHGSND